MFSQLFIHHMVEIGKLVTAMGGMVLNKASSDVDFVIAKNVLAAKYKWALNTLKKPIVLESWLQQCWKEHRVVPHESYRVPPFSGLSISVTQVPPVERKEIEQLVIQNGGRYSAELTKKSTHLVCDAPEGDKYKVAKKWGHLHIVTRAWFNHSVARRACLNEESPEQYADVETTLSQNMASTFSDISVPVSEDCTPPCIQPNSSMNIDNCVAEDSLSDDNDLYLINCKIHIVGFDASEMRKLVNMVRRGGGSRYMSLNEQLTHIVVGDPSESEKKEVRSLSAMGVINVVRTVWLEDCERQKKELPVHRRHVAYDLLLPKDTISSNKGSVSTMSGPKQGKPTGIQPTLPNQFQSLSKGQQKVQHGVSKKSQEIKSSVFRGRSFCFSNSFPDVQRPEVVDWIHEGGGEVVDTQGVKNVNYTVESHGVLCSLTQFSGVTNVSSHWIRSCIQDGHLLDISSHILFSPLQCKVPLPGFIGLQFCVSQYEEKDRELLRNLCHILGGRLNNKLTKKINFLVCKFSDGPKYEAACQWGIQSVTIEWIWECVKQNKIVAFNQFLPKEATISDREAGVCITSQYPTQAVRMISTAGASQLTSQSEDPEIIDGQVDVIKRRKKVKNSAVCSKKPRHFEDGNLISALSSTSSHKDNVCSIISTEHKLTENKPRHFEDGTAGSIISTEHKLTENGGEVSKSVPDVASAIEDLLEQTSKIHDQNSSERTAIDKNRPEVFTSDCSRLGHDINSEDPHSAFGLSKHWTRSSKSNEKDDNKNPAGEENAGIYGGFSETQTESQVVSYEEDLSGRQKIIDRMLWSRFLLLILDVVKSSRRTKSCVVKSSDKIYGVVAKSRDKVSRVVAKSGGDVVTYKASSGDV
nr:hypothetical protein [Tanacetum cinerariifolium]